MQKETRERQKEYRRETHISKQCSQRRERGVKYKARQGDVKYRYRRRQEKDRNNTEEGHI